MYEGFIEKLVLESVKEIFGKVPEGRDKNLIIFAKACNRNLVDFLYVFERLEKKVGIPIASILERRSYSVMTIHGLTKAIVDDFSEIQVM